MILHNYADSTVEAALHRLYHELQNYPRNTANKDKLKPSIDIAPHLYDDLLDNHEQLPVRISVKEENVTMPVEVHYSLYLPDGVGDQDVPRTDTTRYRLYSKLREFPVQLHSRDELYETIGHTDDAVLDEALKPLIKNDIVEEPEDSEYRFHSSLVEQSSRALRVETKWDTVEESIPYITPIDN